MIAIPWAIVLEMLLSLISAAMAIYETSNIFPIQSFFEIRSPRKQESGMIILSFFR